MSEPQTINHMDQWRMFAEYIRDVASLYRTGEQPGRWYRFDNPDEWTCGVKVRDCRVIATGPSLRGIVGWEFGDALELARESGWTVELWPAFATPAPPAAED